MGLDAKTAFAAILFVALCAAIYYAFFSQPQNNPMQPIVQMQQKQAQSNAAANWQGAGVPLLSISVNCGAEVTNSTSIKVCLNGSNLGRCMFSDGENAWGKYAQFENQMSVELANGEDGNRTVNAQCVNADGTQSVRAKGSVALDTKKPQIYVYGPQLSENNTAFEMGYGAEDGQDRSPFCSVFINGMLVQSAKIPFGKIERVSYNSNRQIERVRIECIDWAKNYGQHLVLG